MAAYREHSDQVLIVLLKQDDQGAFAQLYQRYSVRILKKLIRLLKDEELAKEALQDIFLKIWEKRESLDPDKSFRSFLFRIAENQVTDFFRRVALDKTMLRYLVSVTTELCNTTDDLIDFKESKALLQAAIEDLPEQRKKVFILCKIDGKSYEEVAALLGISRGTVNDHMVKAMRVVRKQFTADSLAFTVLLSLIFKM